MGLPRRIRVGSRNSAEILTLNLYDSPADLEPTPESVPWVKKRDGSIVHFDTAKLGSSILAAHERVNHDNPAFVAQELTHAVLHFLSEEYAGHIPSTHDLAETVQKVLREMGHSATGGVYAEHARRRRQMRESIRIVDPQADRASAPSDAAMPAALWDKARLVERLENEADLDRQTAREVATSVERRLLECRLNRVSPLLLDEMVYCDLMEHGVERRWSNRLLVGVPADLIRDFLSARPDPSALVEAVGRQVLSRFALRNVYSRDVAALLDEGVLRLLGGQTPISWSACAISLSADETQETLESQLREAARLIEHVLVIDIPPRSSPTPLTGAALAAAIRGLLSTTSRKVVVCLRAPQTMTDADSHPLFHETTPGWPHPHGLRMAMELAEANWTGCADRVRVDVHVRPGEDPSEVVDRLTAAFGLLRAGVCVAVVVDRSSVSLLEGIPSTPGARVVQYLGIDLSSIFAHVGPAADADWYFHRVGLAADCAVRAGLQKREFLRRYASGRDGGWDGVVLVPLHLDIAARFTGTPWEQDAGISFAAQLLKRLSQRARREASHYQLPCAVDAVPFESSFGDVDDATDREAMSKTLTALAQLHAAVGGGATRLRVSEPFDEAELARIVLRLILQSPIHRLVLARVRPARQLALFE